LKIAIDAMGGDFAPREIVLGAVAACRDLDAEIILVGVEEEIKRELKNLSVSGLKLEIHPASEIISMDEHPACKRRYCFRHNFGWKYRCGDGGFTVDLRPDQRNKTACHSFPHAYQDWG
jgi:hypothetical protein